MSKSTKTTKPAAKKATTKKAAVTKKVAPKKATPPVSAPTPEPTPAPAPKKTAAKKAAVKKAPAKKAPAKKAAVKKAAPKKAPESKTVITAKIDIGFGNTLHLRGSGPSLSWDGGMPMNCVADGEWSITLIGATSPVVFKFLVNDLSWSAGEDFVVEPGSTVVIEPTF